MGGGTRIKMHLTVHENVQESAVGASVRGLR